MLSLPERSFLRNYVMYASELTDANAAYHLLGGLGLLTQTIPDDMYTRHGGKLHGNLYMLAVGRSTNSRKTASVKIAREILTEAIPGAVMTTPGSHEGLADSLGQRPRQLLLLEEFGTLLSQSQRGYLAPVKNVFTEVYDGAPADRGLAVTRKVKVKSTPNPRLSIFGGVTPGYLSEFSQPVDWTEGFFARFLIIKAERVRKILFSKEWPDMRLWLVSVLQDYVSQTAAGKCTGYDPEGAVLWEAFDAHQEKTAEDAPPEIAGAIGRSPGMVQKIAMLLAWDFGDARKGETWKIGAQHIAPAIEIVKMHLQSVFSLSTELAGTPDMFYRQCVLRAVHGSRHPLTLGDISQRARILTKRAQEIITTLLEQRQIEKVHVQEGTSAIEAYKAVTMRERNADVIPLRKIVSVAPPPPPPPLPPIGKPEES